MKEFDNNQPFLEFFETLEPALRAKAKSILRRDLYLDDVILEVMFLGIRISCTPYYSEIVNKPGYFLRITYCRAIDYQRKEKQTEELTEEVKERLCLPDEDNVFQEALSAIKELGLDKVLPPRRWSMFEMYYAEGMSQDEIANHFGDTSRHTVKTQIHLARQFVVAELKKWAKSKIIEPGYY
ncbi:sigma-70 family RNA polymerase sigma factor [uncultured Chitinophaga sp.]|uniref:RNA polymerase sigma factor n=1 Tax=uncultured Chitinophaga sp. TaxID=339340 RepID=UPI0025D34025|nr:sigma-70 family RNA polymerase sigma factor [uncultured Chitinophaga sp.]